jgi:hypothetical protein
MYRCTVTSATSGVTVTVASQHVFGRFTTGTLVNPKEHAYIIYHHGGCSIP